MSDETDTAWERSMRPQPNVPFALSHLAAELLGSLLVIGSTVALVAAVTLIGGGTQGGLADQLLGATMAVVAVPVFVFGRFLMGQHSVSPRRLPPHRGGGDGPLPLAPLEPGPSLRERHVAARRLPRPGPVGRRAPSPGSHSRKTPTS